MKYKFLIWALILLGWSIICLLIKMQVHSFSWWIVFLPWFSLLIPLVSYILSPLLEDFENLDSDSTKIAHYDTYKIKGGEKNGT